MRPHIQPILLGVLLVGIFAVFGCSYSIGDLAQLTPKPAISIKLPPLIKDVINDFQQTSKQPVYDCYPCRYSCCLDWCWDPVRGGWYCCWWGECCCTTCCDLVGWDVTGDLNLTIYVEDPSNDLVEKESPILKIFDSKAVSGKPCKLNISRRDYPLTKDNTSPFGSGFNKTITISIKDVNMRFTSECQVFSAILPIKISCTDRGYSVDSRPIPFYEELITVKDP